MKSSHILLRLCTVMIFTFFLFDEVRGQCIERHKSLLLELKHSLVIDESFLYYYGNYSKLAKWNLSTDCCVWPGVTCSGKYVTGLDLSNEGIVGGFNGSSPLFYLTSLTDLNLAMMYQATVIPSGIGRLVNLMNLNMTGSYFMGQVPIQISNLTRLVSLDFTYCYHLKIENPKLHMLVGNLSNLVELRLSGVDLSSQSREWCQALSYSTPRLQLLRLRGCGLSGPIHISLQNLTQLSHLAADFNNFSSHIPYGVLQSFDNLTYLSLRNCDFYGVFQHGMFQLPTLRHLDLSWNDRLEANPSITFRKNSLEILLLGHTSFLKTIPESIGEARMLSHLDLKFCNLSGKIPKSLSQLEHLVYLEMVGNNLDGHIPSFSRSRNLTFLDLGSNHLNGSILATDWKILPQLKVLILQSNSLSGSIPACLFGSPSLLILLLSENNFTGFTNESNIMASSSNLEVLGLGLNDLQIQGSFPPFFYGLNRLVILDLSYARIDCHISSTPWSNGSYLSYMQIVSLSSNKLHGSIPESICSATYLQMLDLSYNSLSGTLPQCLTQLPYLEVLYMPSNKFSGIIPDWLPTGCRLRTFDLSQNSFQGEIPKSLGGCNNLEVLNLGYNKLNDSFPCWMVNVENLSVLVLRSNLLYGSTQCLNHNFNLTRLQIMDIASNKFVGKLPSRGLQSWNLMMIGKQPTSEPRNLYYQVNYPLHMFRNLFRELFIPITVVNKVSLIVKGYQRNLKKISTVFTLVDFSDNKFEGDIPNELGELKSLYTLNLSHNHLSGQIPESFGNLYRIESLDLSKNELSGKIPGQLAALNFLSAFNVSFNHLEGMIPKGSQFQTFSEASFIGNKHLCGQPLHTSCGNEGVSSPPNPSSKDEDDFGFGEIYIATEIGYALGLGLFIMPLLFLSRWRNGYFEWIDKILTNIFCQRKKSPSSIRRRS